MSANQEIAHVSDTALMVAAIRAMETERADGLVRDPFAAELAGERGMAIARALPYLGMMSFGIAVRSRFLDDLVAHALRNLGIDTIVSLGAGLDTRPWHLALPPALRWIEVDFPAMLDYKRSILESRPPRCRVEWRAADLNEAPSRKELWDAVGSAPALMITEGLLMCLPSGTLEALACEPARESGVAYWLLDISTPALSRMMAQDHWRSIDNVRAPNHLDGSQILDLVSRAGWHSLERRTYVANSLEVATQRIRNMRGGAPPPDQIPPDQAPPADDASGTHLFAQKAGAQ
jgi:methyltransferase (TIGR00027 family)